MDRAVSETKEQIAIRLFAEARTPKSIVSIADALEFRREQYELSRREFCAILGIYPSHYSEILRGKRELPMAVTRRAHAIGVPAEVLLAIREEGR